MNQYQQNKSLNSVIGPGQFNLPEWEAFNQMVSGIFERKYYTNHGPLAKQLEEKLQSFFQVKHAICMTNTGIGMMIALKALDLHGQVIIPSFSHVGMAQAIKWAGLEPVFCEVDSVSAHITLEKLDRILTPNTSAIFAANLFGSSCDMDALEKFAIKRGVKFFSDSSDSLGQSFSGRKCGSYGDLELFSLHESQILSAADGCVLTTNNDKLAARLRNIRSSYGSGPVVPIPFTGNGRLSEIQAGMALLSLDAYDTHVCRNNQQWIQYHEKLSQIPGLSFFPIDRRIENRNFARLVICVKDEAFGISANELAQRLRKLGIQSALFDDYSGHKQKYGLLELPLGSHINSEIISSISNTIQENCHGAKS